jgi:hypothetical protein
MPPSDATARGDHPASAPDANCYTLPNGECVSTKECLHGPPVKAQVRHVPDGDGGYICLCQNNECDADVRRGSSADARRPSPVPRAPNRGSERMSETRCIECGGPISHSDGRAELSEGWVHFPDCPASPERTDPGTEEVSA